MKILRVLMLIPILIGGILNVNTFAQTDASITNFSETSIRFEIMPSATDPRIKEADTPHAVSYNPGIKQGKLLLFIPGTGGDARKGPTAFFTTAIEQGYRVINLSYINTPAIIQICRNENLANCAECAELFRHYRIYGDNNFSLVDDQPHDAIINRFTKLLKYLVEFDKPGNWGMYLENGTLKWDQIVFTGQSQGGGMAIYIAKKVVVAKVIAFSAGWDHANKDEIAKWYFNPGVTPSERLYGTYNVAEKMAKVIDETYRAMAIPDGHIHGLNLPFAKKAHSDGVKNPAYKQIWIEMLGIGN